MNLHDIQTIVNYNYWADSKILAASARVSPEQFVAPTRHNHGTLQGTLLHLIDSQAGWRKLSQHQTNDFCNALTEDDVFGAFPAEAFPTVDVLQQRWNQEELATQEYLASLTDADMNRVVRYKVWDGGVRELLLWLALCQLVNHGTLHRSEAAVIVTDYGSSPGENDFITFLNENPQ